MFKSRRSENADRRPWWSVTGPGLMALCVVASPMLLASAASGQAPPVIDSVSPQSVIHKPVPQPTITIIGSNLRQPGVFDDSGRPTLTIEHTKLPDVSFSAMMNVNFSGTQATLPPGNNAFNMLQMPLGVYDLTLSRPDGAFTTVAGGFSIITQPEPSPGVIEMRVASYWGGPITGMDVSLDGNLAYIANGRMLRVLDLSGVGFTAESAENAEGGAKQRRNQNPSAPSGGSAGSAMNITELGSIYLTGVNDVKVRDGYAFVGASSPHRFCVVDVSDPANPELVWKAYAGGSVNRQVELRGDYAYIADLDGSNIHVWNISDPLNVLHVGTISANAGAFAIADDRLYVGRDSTNHHLSIYDLAANPVQSPLLGTLAADAGTQGRADSIAVFGDYVYIGQKNNGSPDAALLTIDVSNAESPDLVHVLNAFYRAESMAVLDGYLYVAERNGGAGNPPSSTNGLSVLDVSADPAAPAVMASYKCQTNSVPYGVRAGSGANRIYLFEQAEGLIVLDAADPFQPTRLGCYHSPSKLKQMAKSGDHLFVADWYGGFTILDVSGSSAPVVTGTYQAQTWDDIGFAVEGLAVQGAVAFVSLNRRGLDAVDVSDPAKPVLISNFFPPPPNWNNYSLFVGVTVSNTVAHLGFEDWHVPPDGKYRRYLTINIADPQNMFEIARSQPLGNIDPLNRIVLHSSEIAFAADIGYSARMIDVSNVADPHQVGEIVGIAYLDLVLAGNTLFLASHPPVQNNQGLHLFDVSEPLSPSPLAYINTGPAYAVAAQNDRVYTVGLGSSSWLNMHDVSDPAQPIHLVTVTNVGSANASHVLVDEPVAFVTSVRQGSGIAQAGLAIIDIHGLPQAGNPADLNGDGHVDVQDLLILLSSWGPCPPPDKGGCPADLNHSGAVDVQDLLLLLANWG